MPAKYIPNEEELKLILQYYAEVKTYSGVAKKTGLSLSIIKRIVDENRETNIPKTIHSLKYKGAIPVESNTSNINNFKKEIENFYKEILLNGGSI